MNFKTNTMYAAIYRGSMPSKQVSVIAIRNDKKKAYIIDGSHHLIVEVKDLKSFQQQGIRTEKEAKLLKGDTWL